ncbi:hypothetical protein V8C35DRAFT_298338 [Trichoderma chlorosporum]
MTSVSLHSSPTEVLVYYVGDPSNVGEDFDATTTIKKKLQDGNIPLEHIIVLSFAESLLQYGNNDYNCCAWLIGLIQRSPLNEKLANELFPRSKFQKTIILGRDARDLKLEVLYKIRTTFFQTEPLVAIKALLRNSTLFTPSPRVKPIISCIIDIVINEELDLDSEDLISLTDSRLRTNYISWDHSRKEIETALKFVKVTRSLSRIAAEAEDVAHLYGQNYHSIRQIATASEKAFREKMQSNLAYEKIVALQRAAQRLDCWNEYFWLSMMETRRDRFISQFKDVDDGGYKEKPVDDGGEKTLHSNNLTDIFHLEDVACETCCSITSLSAYFTDLMAMLRGTLLKSDPKNKQPSALDVLLSRRPDLENLQLTCANSQVLVPYICLINEVLESFIHYHYDLKTNKAAASERDSIEVYNTPEDVEQSDMDEHSDQPVYDLGYTDDKVYTDIISKHMYPFPIFPYEKPRDEIAQILSSFKVRLLEVVETFRIRQRLIEDIPRNIQHREATHNRLEKGIDETFARQSAAGVLGIQQAEFSAITGETFFPSWFADILNGLSNKDRSLQISTGCPWSTCSLWGYDTTEQMIRNDSTSRLSLIKDGIMRRSGLQFENILELAKTQCFGQDLVIMNKHGTRLFEYSLDGLCLLENSSDPPYRELSEEMCFNLQAFLRLQAKLKWSIRDLDAAIFCLRSREAEKHPKIQRPEAIAFFSISPYVIEGISGIVKLSQLVDIEPAALLPLWGVIDTYGEGSLMHRKFLTPVLRKLSPIFEIPKDGHYLTNKGVSVSLTSEMDAICASLGWPPEYYDKLLEIAEIKDDYLDIASFSNLYRHVLLCQMLSISANDCVRFFKLFFSQSGHKNSRHPLDSPDATFSYILKWKNLLDAGWTIDSMFTTLDTTRHDHGEAMPLTHGLDIITTISHGAIEIRNSFPFLFNDSSPTAGNIFDCVARTFDAQAAEKVVAFIEGTQIQSTAVEFDNLGSLNKAIESSEKWPTKLRLIPDIGSDTAKADLSIEGTLTNTETQAIENISSESESLAYATKDLLRRSMAPGELIRSRFKMSDDYGNFEDNLIRIISGDYPRAEIETAGNSSKSPFGNYITDEEKQRIIFEHDRQERRNAFIKLARPTIIRELMDTLVVNAVQGVVSELDTTLLPIILSEMIRVPSQEGENKESAMLALQRLSEPSTDYQATELNSYFIPSTTDLFTFSLKKTNALVPHEVEYLTINGIKMPLNKEIGAWKSVRMKSGQAYHLQGNFQPSQLLWSTPRTIPSSFTEEMLLAIEKVQTAMNIIAAIQRLVHICQKFQITLEELNFLNAGKAETSWVLDFNMQLITVDMLARLQEYTDFKGKCRPASQQDGVASLLMWLSEDIHFDREVIVSRISACTGWNRSRLSDVFATKYPTSFYASDDIITSLRSFDELRALQAIILLDDRLGLMMGHESRPSISNLFKIAHSQYTLSSAKAAEAVDDLRAGLTYNQRAAVNQSLMENQRNALVAYLLQQPYIKSLDITEADGLFEYFLIDVQMGSQLRTTRIKQAISVVQLFVQRCLLGLEEKIPKESINRDQWKWRQQYTIWEANVKLFLYPENWLEPSLRDDKSSLFEEFEASLMEKNLSMETFAHGISTYVYGLNQIANLEIVSYISDKTFGMCHIFGRTRTSPHTLYHRTLSVIQKADWGVSWKPWAKVDIDMPAVETEWDGKRLDSTGCYLIPVLLYGRLYLFIPQIVPKSVANNAMETADNKDKTFGNLSGTSANVAKPKRIWEITMAWTELSGGNWTPKRVGTETLSFDETVAKPHQIKFESRSGYVPGDSRAIAVYYPKFSDPIDAYKATVYDFKRLGAFHFREDQITSVSADVAPEFGPPLRFLFQPSFQKETVNPVPNLDVDQPLGLSWTYNPARLWLPAAFTDINKSENEKKLKKDIKSISWTLSFPPDTSHSYSISMGTLRSDGTSISYFFVPREGLKEYFVEEDIQKRMDMTILDHSFSHELMSVSTNRVDSLRSVFDTLASQQVQMLPAIYGQDNFGVLSDEEKAKRRSIYHELAQPTALYNWEIGLHSVMAAMDRFYATQQFDEALQVARLVFDPTTDVQFQRYNLKNEVETKKTCWKFAPFQDIASKIGQKASTAIKLADIEKHYDLTLPVLERSTNGALVHATARGRPEAYMKWIVMKYAEILTAAGDVHFRRRTLESLPLAIQRYTEASHILGPEPPRIPQLGKKKPLTFHTLNQEDVDLELKLPFSSNLVRRPNNFHSDDPNAYGLSCFLRTAYFCVPMNPKFRQIRSLVNERLYNIRNSLDIQGRPITYAIIDPLIDPGALLAQSGQGGELFSTSAVAIGDQDSPLPRQRFEFLLYQAIGLCNELRALGDRLLSAIEKKDGETFGALRARHSTAIQKMMLDIKKTHLTEAQQTITALQINRDSQATQLKYFLDLIGEPQSKVPTPQDAWDDISQDIDEPTEDDLRMSSYEKLEMDMADSASALNVVASTIDLYIAPLHLIPDFSGNIQPLGIGATVTMGGGHLAQAASAASTYFKMQAMIASDEANRASRKAQLTRQLQDRRFQANLHGREIKAIDKQIEIQQTRIKASEREIEMQLAEIEESIQIESWYRTKYTNEQLYTWMEKGIRSIYYQAYTLAINAARRAESAFSFERGHNATLLRPGGYWDTARDGLLSAENLYLDLKRLEAAYMEPIHDFEVTKVVSLRQIDPLALLKLRLKGTTTFSLTENLYDTDFPGHYMRRIRSVALSIPAILGPYSSINATLQLTGHQYRISTTVSSDKEYASQNKESFRTNHIPISAVAISSGVQDPGVFELTFNGTKYMPFEGAGAISSWRLDLPDVQKFNYETISDVVLHIQYTAKEGGANLRHAARETVRKISQVTEIKGRDEGFWALWDLKNDFSSEWYQFKSKLLAAKKSNAAAADMQLGNLKDKLPFPARQKAKLKVHNIVWASHNSLLVAGIQVKGISKPGKENIKTGSIGENCSMKTWSGLQNVTNLSGWELSVPTTALGDKDDDIENVYMLIRYTYGA